MKDIFSILAFTMAFLAVLSGVGGIAAAKSGFKVEDGLIKISSPVYEIALQETDGAVKYITDHTGNTLTGGTGAGQLWWVMMGNTRYTGASYKDSFSYELNAGSEVLTLKYEGSALKPGVVVRVDFSSESRIGLSAQVNNTSGKVVSSFALPGDIRLPVSDIEDALLPMLPGVKINSGFFKGSGKYSAIYPGGMFADFIAVNSVKGTLALYGGAADPVQPVSIGFEPIGGKNGYSRLVHAYRTWIDKGRTWQSPSVYLSIASGYEQAIAEYRLSKGIDKYANLGAKLGDKKAKFFESPLYKADVGNGRYTFSEMKSNVVDQFPIPGIIHLVAFQKGGFDRGYPDFVPPDPDMGTQGELADLVAYAKRKGHLVIPYTNFSWWDMHGSTISSLPDGISAKDIIGKAADGSMLQENYGENYGYVANQHHDFVKATIDGQFKGLRDSVGVDGIFEDQWGARVPPMDFNDKGLKEGLDPSTSYFMGVMEHVKDYSGYNLMTECGVDVLADGEVGFNGTNYLWDIKGWKNETAPYSQYYPMAGMLLRDKVLLYQHDLAPETWTDDKYMFKWNLAMGYNFSSEIGNPWRNLAGVFQKFVLSAYADKLVKGYRMVSDGIYLTEYDGFKVYSDWNDEKPFDAAGCTIAPGGAAAISDDGSVTGGVFTSYKGHLLSKGDHYIVETRSDKEIKVFQPRGPETEIHILKPPSWKSVSITACGYDGTVLGPVKFKSAGDDIGFYYYGTFQNKPVGYYKLTLNGVTK